MGTSGYATSTRPAGLEAKCTERNYIQFLIATQRSYSCTEAAKVSPRKESSSAHDALFIYLSQQILANCVTPSKGRVPIKEQV